MSRRLLLPVLLLALSSCETPVDPATVPASIVAINGFAQGGTVGQGVVTQPTFEVRNNSGTALEGVTVSINVTAGGGGLVGAPSSTAAGATAIGTWTLGPAAGVQTVTVSKGSLTPLVFTVNAAPGAAAGVAITGGNNQSAIAGAATAAPVIGSVVDQYGNPRPGETVNWNITAGGGSLTGSSSTVANGSGFATAPSWTLGKNGGTQTLRASQGAFEAFANANIQSTYTVDLRWVGTPPTGPTLAAFTRAVDRIRATITTAVSAVNVGALNLADCGSGLTGNAPAQANFTGVIIYAVVEPIDGAGQVLGSAGPCLIRLSDNSKTALGTMRFDSADMATMVGDGRIDAVILHEMLHVVGVGTNWPDVGLLTGSGTADARFTGAQARSACANTNGGPTTCAATVPVHSTDGAGSAYSHWRESTFGTELMSPFIAPGQASPLSAMTVASLADMGYVSNLNTQDAFLVPGGSVIAALRDESSAGSTTAPMLRLPEPVKATFGVDRMGRVIRIRGLR